MKLARSISSTALYAGGVPWTAHGTAAGVRAAGWVRYGSPSVGLWDRCCDIFEQGTARNWRLAGLGGVEGFSFTGGAEGRAEAAGRSDRIGG